MSWLFQWTLNQKEIIITEHQTVPPTADEIIHDAPFDNMEGEKERCVVDQNVIEMLEKNNDALERAYFDAMCPKSVYRQEKVDFVDKMH